MTRDQKILLAKEFFERGRGSRHRPGSQEQFTYACRDLVDDLPSVDEVETWMHRTWALARAEGTVPEHLLRLIAAMREEVPDGPRAPTTTAERAWCNWYSEHRMGKGVYSGAEQDLYEQFGCMADEPEARKDGGR